MFSKIFKSMTCGTLALLVSYVTLGPIMQPANLVSASQLADATALHSDAGTIVGQPS